MYDQSVTPVLVTISPCPETNFILTFKETVYMKNALILEYFSHLTEKCPQ